MVELTQLNSTLDNAYNRYVNTYNVATNVETKEHWRQRANGAVVQLENLEGDMVLLKIPFNKCVFSRV